MFLRLSLLLLVPASLFAQDSTSPSDSTPFRKGQWAAQFQGASSFGSLGFLKFRSPNRALVLDVRLGGGHNEIFFTDSTGTRFAGLRSDAFVNVRFGWRRYRGGAARIVSHYSVGLIAGLDHGVEAAPTGRFGSDGWTAGVFGDVGATYLLTPKFGLGALGTASLTYSRSRSESEPSGNKTHTWRIGGNAVSASLVATVFF